MAQRPPSRPRRRAARWGAALLALWVAVTGCTKLFRADGPDVEAIHAFLAAHPAVAEVQVRRVDPSPVPSIRREFTAQVTPKPDVDLDGLERLGADVAAWGDQNRQRFDHLYVKLTKGKGDITFVASADTNRAGMALFRRFAESSSVERFTVHHPGTAREVQLTAAGGQLVDAADLALRDDTVERGVTGRARYRVTVKSGPREAVFMGTRQGLDAVRGVEATVHREGRGELLSARMTADGPNSVVVEVAERGDVEAVVQEVTTASYQTPFGLGVRAPELKVQGVSGARQARELVALADRDEVTSVETTPSTAIVQVASNADLVGVAEAVAALPVGPDSTRIVRATGTGRQAQGTAANLMERARLAAAPVEVKSLSVSDKITVGPGTPDTWEPAIRQLREAGWTGAQPFDINYRHERQHFYLSFTSTQHGRATKVQQRQATAEAKELGAQFVAAWDASAA